MDRSQPQPRALLAVLLGGQALASIDTAVANVATPSIQAHLGATGAELQLVISGYVLAYAMLLIPGARLGHIHGYRRLFLLGVGLFNLASLACGLAPNPVALIVARVVQGTAAALLVPQVLSGIQHAFTGAERSRAVGWFVVMLSTSAVVGQILGGALVDADLFGTAWRPIFLVNVPIGAIVLLAAARCLPPDAPRRPVRLDLGGVASLSVALLLLVVPLVLGRELGWPLWSWACLLLSLPAFGVFVAVERQATGRGDPLLNLAVLARPSIAWALGARLAAASTYFALLFVLALFLQQGLGETPLFAGLALVSWVAAFGLAAPALHAAPARLVQQAAWLGALAMVLAYLVLGGACLGGRPNPLVLAAILGLGGFGFGVTTAALLDRLIDGRRGDEHAADLSGLYQATSQVAGVAGVATFGTLYLALGWLGARSAFALTCLAFGAVAAVATLAAARARPRRVAASGIAGRVLETRARRGAHGYAGDY